MTHEPLIIDGSQGEGGGQILRSSLSLSLMTGRPFEIRDIRAGRKKPGLLRQHLTAVRAAADIGLARIDGAELGATRLSFAPEAVQPGDYFFAVGSAGSATLVLQTVLPALITASGPSHLVLEGGTHNPFAPPFDFIERAFLPLLERMGARVEVSLDRPGFYPAGGGRFRVDITPTSTLEPLELLERGETRSRRARAHVAGLARAIAVRELAAVADAMSWRPDELVVEMVSKSRGPGNLVTLEIESDHVTEVFTGFGQRGVRAEAVAKQAVTAARRYLKSDAPVAEYLADQLLLPLAVAGGGSFRATTLSRHTRTNIQVIEQFMNVDITTRQESKHAWRVDLSTKEPS